MSSEVERRGGDHRRRLVAAMIEAASLHGYGGATVARVVELAGVSRATFYAHFRDREDCFLAAHQAALDVAARSCARAAPDDRPYAPLASLLEAASADPAMARLLLIEAKAAPPRVRAEHHRLVQRAEQVALESGRFRLRLPPAALQGGLTAVVSSALLDGGETSPADLLPALSAWLRCYETPPGAEVWEPGVWSRLGRQLVARFPEASLHPPAAAPRPRLPRGRSAAPPALSAVDRRRRLLEATAEVVARKGYPAASVADVVASARVTRGAFYSHFDSKLDAFLGALTKNLQESIAAAAGEFFLAAEWPDRVWRGLQALLAYFAENPDSAYLGMVEIYAAGKLAIRRAAENRAAFGIFIVEGYQQNERAAALPLLCSEAIAGAIDAIVSRRLLAGEAHRVLELLPQCAYVALAPFIGVEAASALVVANSGGDPPAGRTA